MDREYMAENSSVPEVDNDDAPEVALKDHYELAMAPKRLTNDLLVQVTIFMYAYAK